MHLVISMINVRPLSGLFTVFRMCCEAALRMPDVRVTALCHSLEDVKCINAPNVNFIAYPLSQKSGLFRLLYEYIYFNFLAKKLKPDFWLYAFLSPKCHNAVVCESSYHESQTAGIKKFIKKIFLSRITTAYVPGKSNAELLKRLDFGGKFIITHGVGLYRRIPTPAYCEKSVIKKFIYVGRLSAEKNLFF